MMRKLVWVCFLGVIGGWFPLSALCGEYPTQFHRGGGNDRPENTLETFLWAWEMGVAPEADVRLTKDGVPIAFHDNELNRLGRHFPESWRDVPVAQLTWEQLQNVDVGSYLNPRYAAQRIAPMTDVFAAMKEDPRRMLYLDEKGATPQRMAQMSKEYGVQSQVIFASPNRHLLVEWKKLAPEGKAMLWVPSWNVPDEKVDAFLWERLEKLAADGFPSIDIIQIHVYTDLSKPDPFKPSSAMLKRVASLLKENGIHFQAISWSQGDRPETYRKLMELGVQSFATDHPQPCLEAIRSEK
ncbi:MAG: glycerophosphodiester phosphodiesterase family protein [Planctomycetia bacterium]|nr:glycerophosphodiester phosphodiesterase family protein [Planctomycetia bacterium]